MEWLISVTLSHPYWFFSDMLIML